MHMHIGKVLETSGKWNVIDCVKCRYKHLDPIPEPMYMMWLYRDAYYVDEKPDYIEGTTKDREWIKMHNLDLLSLLGKPGRLFELGCGPGWFLLDARSVGWEEMGIDLSIKAIRHAQALGVYALTDCEYLETRPCVKPFDAVVMLELLEHAINPVGLLKDALQALKPSGRILIKVPNDWNALQSTFRDGRPAWWVSAPWHVNYFDFNSISSLLDECGFIELDRLGTFPMEVFLMMGRDYIGRPDIGRKCHEERMKLELGMSRDDRLSLYRALAKKGIGREIVILAKKENAA